MIDPKKALSLAHILRGPQLWHTTFLGPDNRKLVIAALEQAARRVTWLLSDSTWIGCSDGSGEADVWIQPHKSGGWYVDMSHINGRHFPVKGDADAAKAAVEKALEEPSDG